MLGRMEHPQRDAAITMLLTGASVAEVSEALGVHQVTVARWRKSPEYLEEQGRVRAAAREAVIDRLSTAAQLAAERLVELLRSESESVALRAATAILDRVGPPAASEVRLSRADELDLSGLTLEELQTWRALVDRARGVG